MKRVMGQPEENTFELLGFDVLTSKEMNEVRGGLDTKPKSRDKDVYEFDED